MKFGKAKWLSAALIAVCLPAAAQDITPKMKANIPFNFVAGSQYLPAGHYTIAPVFKNTLTAWRITSDDAHSTAAMITSDASSPIRSHRRSLMFQRIGGNYVLTEFWTEEHSGREMPKPHETQNAEAGKSVEVAAE